MGSAAMGPPRDPNQPDEQSGWSQVDHSRDPSHPNIPNKSGFAAVWLGIAEM
jgi:hypothetical protein